MVGARQPYRQLEIILFLCKLYHTMPQQQSSCKIRAIAFENQKIIMEVQEEIISSWWVQGKALLEMCGVSAEANAKHSRTPHKFVPRRGTLWEGGRPTCTVSLVATVRKLANALALPARMEKKQYVQTMPCYCLECACPACKNGKETVCSDNALPLSGMRLPCLQEWKRNSMFRQCLAIVW
ncbi:hypothetical protein [Candidatus Magnetaquicoccus inordinatus]|uniref:hypothetical protein n=1 Tax=Candidatus Magnetaquicoccus inordinatus TaxID=2496818 RepID=UPI00187D0E50|nr:hypothetical protein [Candidatus Magnetaquicoccus inordinatus]